MTTSNIDYRARTLDLHPKGAPRTKKRNAVVPIADALMAWLPERSIEPLPLVSWEGRALGDIKTAWRRTRARAGLEKKIIPYVCRHTFATELRRRGIPLWEVAGLMGHSGGNRTTEGYAQFSPSYASESRKAIDAWMNEIGGLEPPARPVGTQLRASCVLEPVAC